MASSPESICLVPPWHGEPLASTGHMGSMYVEHVTWRNTPSRVAGRRRTHSHDVFHVVVFDAPGASCVVDGMDIDTNGQAVILTNPGQEHVFAGRYGAGGLYHELTFRAPEQSWSGLLARIFETNLSVDSVHDINGEMYNSFESVIKRMCACLFEQQTQSRVYCAAYVQRLLFSVFRLLNEQQSSEQADDPWDGLRQWIESHAEEDWDLTVLAEQMHCSVKHVSRQFSRRFSVPPLRYKKQIILERARVLLRSTDFTLQDISDRLGIHDAHYFNRLFRQAFGVAPARYRAHVRS